jgi:hypothetical protein
MAKATNKPKSAKSKPRSSAVPGSFRGFSYQATRFLVHLLRGSSDSCVCLEVFEDVGVEHSDGTRLAEQNKSYLSRNALAPRSSALWKTLKHWVTDLKEGRLDAQGTSFILCAPGATPCDIVEQFHAAASDADAQKAIVFAKSKLFGDAEKSTNSEDIVFAFNNQKEFAAVVSHLVIETPAMNADELKPLFLARLVSEDGYEHVMNWAHGWVKTKIDEALGASLPARIRVNEFHSSLLNYVRAHDRLDILQSYAGIPAPGDIQNELAVRDYVRQLQIINLEDEGILEAVNDYLRAVIDRTHWAENGVIDEATLDTFAKDLTSTWRNIRRRTHLAHASQAEPAQGQLLYSECIEHQAMLDGFPPPNHFVKGSFHALSDDRSIGWHPKYETLLPQENKDDDDSGGT